MTWQLVRVNDNCSQWLFFGQWWTAQLLYTGLAFMVAVSLWDLFAPPRARRAAVPVLESVLTCPACGHAKPERMPVDACQWFYECKAVLRSCGPSRVIAACSARMARSAAHRPQGGRRGRALAPGPRAFFRHRPLRAVCRAWPIPSGEVCIYDPSRKAIHGLRDESSALHVRSAICTHLGCVVAWNSAEKSWDCPCHSSRFGVDGEVLHGPAGSPLATEDI